MSQSFHPIACSLPLAESRNQINEWHEVARNASSREQIEGGLAVTLPSASAEVVEDLARRESACCGFLSIDTERIDQGIRLEMRSEDPAALPVIELLLAPQGS